MSFPPPFQCAAIKSKAILQLILAAAESHPQVFTVMVATQPFFHANAHHVLCMHLISHTGPQLLYQHRSKQGEQEPIMALLLLHKKAGFICINICSRNLSLLCVALIKMLLSWPFWTVPNLLQYTEMKQRTDYSDLPKQAVSLDIFKWKGKKLDTSGYFTTSFTMFLNTN